MQEIQFVDKKRVHLNSKYGVKRNGTMLSDIIFDNKSDLIRRGNDVLFSEINLCCCEIPYSFYVINNANNILGLSTGDITLINGNYNVKTFKVMIDSLLVDGMTFEFNKITGKGSLVYSDYFFITGNTTCCKIIGVVPGIIYYAIDNVINMPFLMDLTGTKNLYIKTCSLFLSSVANEGEHDILHVVPNNVNPYGIIYYNNLASNFFHNISDQELSAIEIKIYDDENNLVNFNNIGWSISLQINIHRIKLIHNDKFLTFGKGINNVIDENDDNVTNDNVANDNVANDNIKNDENQ